MVSFLYRYIHTLVILSRNDESRILDSKFKSIYKILLFFLELLAYFTTFNHKKVYHNTTCEECCRSVGFPQRAILKYIIPDLEWNTWNTRSSYPGME